MTRLTDWRSRLHTYIAENASRAFQPGVFDCSLFSAGAVDAMTGTDPAAAYRGNYTTIEEGQALLQADGYADQIAFLEAQYLGHPSVLDAGVGDLAVVSVGSETGIGVVIGDRVAVVTEKGLGHIPLRYAERAFIV